MKKVISIMIAALMSAASWAQVNPKINQLFEELKQTKGALYPTAPSIMKRGGSITGQTSYEAGKKVFSWIAFCK